MTRRQLPPADRSGGSLRGPNVKSFGVVSWCPTHDGSGPPTAVAIVIETDQFADIVLRIKTPERVDELIQMLLRHKRDVWPEAR